MTTIGSTKRHYARFYASDGETPADPTSVRLRTREPETGAEKVFNYGADPEIVKESVGVYYYDAFYEIAGRHRRRWEATGAVQAIIEEWTDIAASAFVYLFTLSPTDVIVGSPSIGTPPLAEV